MLKQAMAVFRLSALALVAAIVTGGSGWTQAAGAEEAASLAAWDKIAAVLRHPRCLNCHQLERPLQGDSRRVHIPPAARGTDDMGTGTMRCHNCHNDSGNNQLAGVPGALHWKLAPVVMSWEGLSTGDLCRMLKDAAHNGNRAPEALVEHVETEHLVLWGWNPGGRRDPVRLRHEDFVEQMKMWVAGGAVCPP